MRTRTWRERWIAVGIVVGWHALVGWWLSHRLPVRDGAGAEVLQVVYVALPPLRVREPATLPDGPSGSDRGRASLSHATAATGRPAAAGIAEGDGPPAAGTLPTRALESVHRETAPDFRRDPFADRPARLPGEGKGRFRMRSISPADVVAAIGAGLFYPPGYERDQCPRNRRNIADLLAGGDSPRLRQELEYEREYCRP